MCRFSEESRCALITSGQVIANLKQRANAQAVEGMARFGIRPAQALGVSIPTLRKMAKEIGRDQTLALALWDSGIHEARILASMIAEPHLVSAELMDEWVSDFDAWDVCDQVCGKAGFVLMAELAVHDKRARDEAFVQFFPLIKRYADDERNFVKKAVNWALRQIGKRNSHLCACALEYAYEIQAMDSKAARWVARDALKELQAKEIKD